MIIVMRPGAARADVERVVERVHKAGLTTHLSEGERARINRAIVVS